MTRSRVATVVVAVAASSTVLAYLLLRLPGWEAVAVVGATLLPAGLVLYGGGLRRASAEVRRKQDEVVAQRDIALREVQRSTETNIELQRANAAMGDRVAELTALNEISVALSTTLDMDELIDRALQAVVTHLRFDRALVLLADDERGVLAGGRAVGGAPDMVERIATLELPLDLAESQLVALYHADGPLLFRDVDQDAHEPNRALAKALGVTSFVGTPIMTTTRAVGVLAVDNRSTGRQVGPSDGPLLYTLGNLLGAAIENARLYAEARRDERMLDAFREIAIAILSGTGSDEALALIARRAMELVEADLATVAALDPVGRLTLRVAEGAHAEELRGATFPPKGSISGEAIRSGRAIVVPDATRDARAYQPVVKLGNMGPMILVPLSQHGRAIGTLNAARERGGRAFSQEDVELLQRFADQAAIALQYARAQREAQRVAVLEDRERIAKELHDGVIQALFAVGMGLQGTALMSPDADHAARVEGAVAELDRVIRDLRNYIFGLRPGILADRQLDQALRQTAREFEDRSGVVTVVDIDELIASELASTAADVIQAAREALSNVGRHAEATTCRLSLHREEDSAVLEVDDDGRGFDPETTRRGDGLTNLEERAEEMGGKISIESAPDQGTMVRILIPL